jgi:hypothetical protein
MALVFTLLFEILLRLSALIPQNSSFFISDPDVGFRMRPGMPLNDKTTNKKGFNDIDRKQQKRLESKRITIIGDSFVVGIVQREKNFVYGIQTRADQSGLNIEMLNMGIAASGPYTYQALIKKDAVIMNTDVVGVLFFIGNDIIQSHPDFRTKVWLGSPRQILKKQYMVDFSKEYFYLFRMFRSMFRLINEKKDKPADATFSLKNYLAIEYGRSAIMKTSQNKSIRKSYDGAITILQQMAILAKERKMKFFVILAPDELQVNQQLQNMVVKEYSLKRSEFDFELPQKILTKQLKKSGILYIDLLPFFKNHDSHTALYAKQDSHWNELGNKLAAEKIWLFIKEETL